MVDFLRLGAAEVEGHLLPPARVHHAVRAAARSELVCMCLVQYSGTSCLSAEGTAASRAVFSHAWEYSRGGESPRCASRVHRGRRRAWTWPVPGGNRGLRRAPGMDVP